MDGLDPGFVYVFVSAAVTLIVDWIRKASSKINGIVVNLIAWGVGIIATLAPIPAFAGELEVQGRALAGFALAAGASVIAEIKATLAATRKLNKAALEAEHGEGRFDEGYNPGDPGYTAPVVVNNA